MKLPLRLEGFAVRDAEDRVVISGLNPCDRKEREEIVRAVNATMRQRLEIPKMVDVAVLVNDATAALDRAYGAIKAVAASEGKAGNRALLDGWQRRIGRCIHEASGVRRGARVLSKMITG